MSGSPRERSGSARAMPLLVLEDVHKTYRLGGLELPVLRGVDLTIEAGELIAILGPPGAGKSSLLNVIGGVETAARGRVHVEGVPLDDLDPRGLARLRERTIGVVYQVFALSPDLTAAGNLELAAGSDHRGLPLPRVLELAGLRRSDERPARQLSTAERQRVAIARALLRDPSLILCDLRRPNDHIDELVAILAGVNRELGKAVVLVADGHSLHERVDRVVQLEGGRVVPTLTPCRAHSCGVTRPPAYG